MMRSIAVVLSFYLFNCAFALPAPAAEGPIFKPKEIKFDGSADWSRVIGGFSASSGQFPYMASLRRLSSNSHFCGAAIVSSRYLLSAAHCTDGATPSAITAVVGTTLLNSGGTGYVLENIIIHPNFTYVTVANDISILRTVSSIAGSSVVASIPINSGNLGAEVTVTFTGWGVTDINNGSNPNNLQFINLRTINNTECAERHSVNPYPIFLSSLCTFTQDGEGACYGDSGGPLAASGILVGLVSWSAPCAVGFPDVFTRVSSYVTWIQENAT